MNEIENYSSEQLNELFVEITDRISIQNKKFEGLEDFQKQIENLIDVIRKSDEEGNRANWLLLGNRLIAPQIVESVKVIKAEKREDIEHNLQLWGLLINGYWEYFALGHTEGEELLQVISGSEVEEITHDLISTPENVEDDSSSFNLTGMKMARQRDASTLLKNSYKYKEEETKIDEALGSQTFQFILEEFGFREGYHDSSILQTIIDDYKNSIQESCWNPDDFRRFLNRHYLTLQNSQILKRNSQAIKM